MADITLKAFDFSIAFGLRKHNIFERQLAKNSDIRFIPLRNNGVDANENRNTETKRLRQGIARNIFAVRAHAVLEIDDHSIRTACDSLAEPVRPVGGDEERCDRLSIAHAASDRYGTIVEIIPVDANGRIDLNRLAGTISEDVICVVAMAVNNEIGTVQDIPAVAAICAAANVHFVCDAVQAPLAINLDVDRCEIPLLVLSAHKIYGPKGIGALYVRRDVRNSIEPQVYVGGQQCGLRAGTLPTPLCVGFGTAATLLETQEAVKERAKIESLRDRFENGLRRLGHPIAINGADAPRHPGNSNARFRDRDGRDLIAALQPKIAVSSGSACSSGIIEPSHVLRAIGLTGEEANSSVRFSFGRFTTEADIAATIEALSEAISEIA